jgi:hypothetical protein
MSNMPRIQYADMRVRAAIAMTIDRYMKTLRLSFYDNLI